MDFSKLKKRKFNVDSLIKEAEKVSGNNKKKSDERFWTPSIDKSGNGFAVIRFLPTKEYFEDESSIPWVRYWDHGFKGDTGKWYIEKSLTSLGQQDPLGELNSRMWATEDPEQQEIVRSRKRRLHHVSNILVVNDPENPDNNGKVFLYRFGKKIMDKIMDSMQPEFPGEEPIVPFNVFGGANFQLKIRNVAGFRNYDKSDFAGPSDLADGDTKVMKKIFEELHDIKEFVDPANYKSYAELEARLNDVLGIRVESSTPAAPAPAMKVKEAKKVKSKEPEVEYDDDTTSEDTSPTIDFDDDDEDVLKHFEKLAQSA